MQICDLACKKLDLASPDKEFPHIRRGVSEFDFPCLLVTYGLKPQAHGRCEHTNSQQLIVSRALGIERDMGCT